MMIMKIFNQFLAKKNILYDFSSTQLNLPVDLADSIVTWGEKNIPNKFIYSDFDNPNFGREYEPHVTVLSKLHTDNPNDVQLLLKSQEIPKCKLGKMSLFSNNEFDVLKIDVKCQQLHKLYTLLKNNLQFTDINKNYQPHITIAYLNKDKGSEYINNTTFENETFQTKYLTFCSRTGKQTFLLF